MVQGVKRRFSAEQEEASVAAPKKIKKIEPMAVGKLLGLAVGILLSAVVGFVVVQILVIDVKQQQLEELSQQRAQLAADTVQAYIKETTSQLAFYARKPLLSASFAVNDTKYLKDTEEKILKRLDGVLSVRLHPRQTAKLNKDIFPPIRFSELEMIRRAEHRESVLPEAFQLEGKWYLNFVLGAPDDPGQEPVGTLLATFDLSVLNQKLQQSVETSGQVQLTQSFGANQSAQVVVLVGQGELATSKSVIIPESFWSINFTASRALSDQTHVNMLQPVLIIVVASLILIGLAVYVGMRLAQIAEINRLKKQSVETGSVSGVTGESELVNPIYQTSDILDVEIAEEDEELLGLESVEDGAEIEPIPEEEDDIFDLQDAEELIPESIFRAYDIRGIAREQISNELAKKIGQALGSEAIDYGEDTLIVARDARTHSPEITEWFIRGVLSTGCNVLNIGTVPTPLLYFATETLDQSQSGVMVTASHNPAEYNGFKIVMNGRSRTEEEIKGVRTRIIQGRFHQGVGQEFRHDIVPSYIDTIFSDVALAGDVSIVVDAGNGVTGVVAPRLFEELGCQVTPMFCDFDGSFPNHAPDPSVEENLLPLVEKVKELGADIGVAFDGDGDRLAVVTPGGKIIWPDRLLMLFAKDIVARNPGADVVFDVKCTRHLNQCISLAGGRPVMWKTGHSPMKEKMIESGALLGGEFSGHIFIKDRWYGFDDGMYAAARLIEILSLQGESLDQMFEEFESSISTPEIRVEYPDEQKFDLMQKLVDTADFLDGKITTIDGIRVDYPKGWGLVRASNTTPGLTLRFEAEDEEFLHKLKSLFVRELRKVDNTINVDWNQ
ncbi:phosphomannomutase/phosphoglucomutase [Teredinibacter sp. KSP-S5-2]|uniref:phosphomannomutase/phosphoglucomutase n=1 Tax=Teredinibacter sp. KSP-S5-2 TaxID=3034506 RepID=UPI00293482E1|nr:phosphomannomutase/phosphoglucomutase [Teredinibacter sp. KSP-S5-2]WNO09314.1 phosphomannomutase/phosphoglucomutase [Teredinibacter sp. KSP-S5-2]